MMCVFDVEFSLFVLLSYLLTGASQSFIYIAVSKWWLWSVMPHNQYGPDMGPLGPLNLKTMIFECQIYMIFV